MARKLMMNNAGNITKEPSLFNEFVFDTNKTTNNLTVSLQNYRGGDTTIWDGLTDWGDGTIDTKYSHTYSVNGIYTVKTKYLITSNEWNQTLNTATKLVSCNALNTNITDATLLFYKCSNLTSLDLSNLSSNIKITYCMLMNCSNLVSLNLSNFKSTNITDMSYMFLNCSKLKRENIILTNVSAQDIAKLENAGMPV